MDVNIGFALIALSIVALGYFIGDGLKNFKNPQAKTFIEKMDEADDDKYSLIPEKEIHYYIGVSKEDAKKLIQEHANIPHITINGTNYFPKEKLRQWLKEIG